MPVTPVTTRNAFNLHNGGVMISVDQLSRPSIRSTTLDSPLDHLVACHGRIEEKLAILERAAVALNDQPEEARAALQTVFRHFDTAGVLHTRDEEESVFPRLLLQVSETERFYLRELEQQHRDAEEVYALLRDVPAQGSELTEYVALVHRFCHLYRKHIASENERLIGTARRVLSDEELAEVAVEMKGRRAR